jgi:hypothetical protein
MPTGGMETATTAHATAKPSKPAAPPPRSRKNSKPPRRKIRRAAEAYSVVLMSLDVPPAAGT